MHNWSTDTTRLKEYPEQYAIWRLEQQLNYGLAENEKIDRSQLEKYLPELNIDQDTRNFLELLLYDKKPA
ncbi:hypothetical protein NO1_1453 [Candidatus Termititenax aidoneus]|uniref:Uncharacterized protein n=1 Tax=Termititenax aidoneus TaxID=2218524 RepID=A0A388TBS5_TERA1|nr:hypothetical protein NO1_1453 [Candidatus Termititenax aidoneus]